MNEFKGFAWYEGEKVIRRLDKGGRMGLKFSKTIYSKLLDLKLHSQASLKKYNGILILYLLNPPVKVELSSEKGTFLLTFLFSTRGTCIFVSVTYTL